MLLLETLLLGLHSHSLRQSAIPHSLQVMLARQLKTGTVLTQLHDYRLIQLQLMLA